MLLIAQIILTIIVWRKNWKWLSLIPIGTGFLIGFLLGFSGILNQSNSSLLICIDVLIIIALGIMCAHPRKIKK